MDNTHKDKKFYEMADAFIALANEQSGKADQGTVSATFLYAAARFNTFIVASGAGSSLEDSKESIKCPIDAFDKIVMSVTNTPPDVEEILSGKFYGVANPIFQEMIFDGYGHEIHAILVWGVSLHERDKQVKD